MSEEYEKALERAQAAVDRFEEKVRLLEHERSRQKWEYMVLCPDSEAGYRVLLQEVGEEGWEAVCSWADVRSLPRGEQKRTNHILFKRPA